MNAKPNANKIANANVKAGAQGQADRSAVEQFLYLEARLQDEHRYDEWEALWTDDALYWVPAGGDDIDPSRQVSYIYDNRARIASRIRQLKTGQRHAQSPVSRMRRLISNVEVHAEDAQGVLVAESNFILVESRHARLVTWAGRTIHRLRSEGGSFRMCGKKVLLVNNDAPIPNMAFLI